MTHLPGQSGRGQGTHLAMAQVGSENREVRLLPPAAETGLRLCRLAGRGNKGSEAPLPGKVWEALLGLVA